MKRGVAQDKTDKPRDQMLCAHDDATERVATQCLFGWCSQWPQVAAQGPSRIGGRSELGDGGGSGSEMKMEMEMEIEVGEDSRGPRARGRKGQTKKQTSTFELRGCFVLLSIYHYRLI